MSDPLTAAYAAAGLPYTSALDETDPAVLARVVTDLRRRLTRACAGLPAAEFDALVEVMARRALRWAARG
jgi:hypothetical protein